MQYGTLCRMRFDCTKAVLSSLDGTQCTYKFVCVSVGRRILSAEKFTFCHNPRARAALFFFPVRSDLAGELQRRK